MKRSIAAVVLAAGMLKRVSVEQPMVFAGGVARNACMIRLLEEALQTRGLVPESPQMVGALGAALLACGINRN